MRNLPCNGVQCDEIWALYGRAKEVAPERRGILCFRDVYTWTALSADTKLVWPAAYRIQIET
jgi:hypothetical protein